jgi:hypothetical protein
MEVRVATLMDNLAVAVMQANNLAADSPEYEALAEILAYALDLTEFGLSIESNAVVGSLEPPKAC